jgi:hypothetical protein
MLGTRPSMSTSIGGIFGVLCRTSAAEGGGATQVMAMVNVLKVGVRVAVRCAGSAGAYPLAWAFDLWTQREVPLPAALAPMDTRLLHVNCSAASRR